jgi:putative membrane protein
MAIVKLFLHIVSGGLGLFIAAKFVPGVDFFGSYFMLGVVGIILGLANFFIKPVLKAVSLPIRILTLGLFSLIINMALVWLVADVAFPDVIEISGLLPLLWTTLIIWFLSLLLGLHNRK